MLKDCILIAENDPRFVIAARNLLVARIGNRYRIKTSTDGAQAATLLGEDPPALAVLGTRLAGKTALEILKELSAKRQFSGTRFVAIVEKSDDATARTLVEAGAAGCLQRPLQVDSFVTRIVEYMLLREVGGAPATRDDQGRRGFDVLVARGDGASGLKRDLERRRRVPVLLVDDPELAVVLTRSPSLRAIFIQEPIPAWSSGAVIEYVRAEGARVPVIRISEKRDLTNVHPDIRTISPAFELEEIRQLEGNAPRAAAA
jgi:ActR/RegA family two-component response regulator